MAQQVFSTWPLHTTTCAGGWKGRRVVGKVRVGRGTGEHAALHAASHKHAQAPPVSAAPPFFSACAALPHLHFLLLLGSGWGRCGGRRRRRGSRRRGSRRRGSRRRGSRRRGSRRARLGRGGRRRSGRRRHGPTRARNGGGAGLHFEEGRRGWERVRISVGGSAMAKPRQPWGRLEGSAALAGSARMFAHARLLSVAPCKRR